MKLKNSLDSFIFEINDLISYIQNYVDKILSNCQYRFGKG